MLTPNKLEQLSYKTAVYYEELQEWVIKEIAERISRTLKASYLTNYQIKRLQELRLFNKDFIKKVSQISKLSEKEVKRIFKDAGSTNLINDREVFKEKGVKYMPLNKSPYMIDLTMRYAVQTNNEIKNLTRTLGFKSSNKMLNKTLSVRDFFIKTLDKQYMLLDGGFISYDDAIKNVIQDMTTSGLRTVDYESGFSNRIDVAVRRSLLGAVKNMTNIQAEINAKLLGSTCFEITWHTGHRPSHLWGGRRFDTTGKLYLTEEKLYEKYSDRLTGEVGTLEDYNCYHEKFVVLSDSKPRYSNERLNELEANEIKQKEYEGKKYNVYEARQKQRQLETAMRKVRLDAVGNKAIGNQEKYMQKKVRYNILRAKYKEFSETMGLKTEYQRVYYDRLGKI